MKYVNRRYSTCVRGRQHVIGFWTQGQFNVRTSLRRVFCMYSPPLSRSQMVRYTTEALETVGCLAQGHFNNTDTCLGPRTWASLITSWPCEGVFLISTLTKTQQVLLEQIIRSASLVFSTSQKLKGCVNNLDKSKCTGSTVTWIMSKCVWSPSLIDYFCLKL